MFTVNVFSKHDADHFNFRTDKANLFSKEMAAVDDTVTHLIEKQRLFLKLKNLNNEYEKEHHHHDNYSPGPPAYNRLQHILIE